MSRFLTDKNGVYDLSLVHAITRRWPPPMASGVASADPADKSPEYAHNRAMLHVPGNIIPTTQDFNAAVEAWQRFLVGAPSVAEPAGESS
jgi:hypothetical protein